MLVRLVVGAAPFVIALRAAGATAESAASGHAHSGRWLTFGLDRISWLRGEVMSNPLWQYLASLLYIALAFYAAKLLDYFIQSQWAACERVSSLL